MAAKKHVLFDPPIVSRALGDAVTKLAPRNMVRNPVMFVVLLGSVLTTLVLVRDVVQGRGDIGFTLQITLWLWFTVLFANFAEAMAEGRGKAQADTLRASRTQTKAKKLDDPALREKFYFVPATELERGDFVLCEPGDVIPSDGEVAIGVASVDESAITGESARRLGGRRGTGGTSRRGTAVRILRRAARQRPHAQRRARLGVRSPSGHDQLWSAGKMKYVLATSTVTAVTMAIGSSHVAAQPPAAPDTSVTIKFGGFVDGYFAYDFNRPTTFDRSFTTQPARSNELNVNLAYIEAALSANWLRGRFALQAGTSVQSNYAAEPSNGSVSGPSLARNIQEAFAGYQIAPTLWIDGGIFYSNMGMESWVSRDNPTYTRSWSPTTRRTIRAASSSPGRRPRS